MKANDIFSSKYLSAADLRDRDATVTIDRCEIDKMQNGEKKLVVYFVNKAKGFLVNRTNFNTIAEVLGVDDTADWEGQSITLYPTETDFQGKMVDCIRVRRKKASTAPQSPEKTDSWVTTEQSIPVEDDLGEEIPF